MSVLQLGIPKGSLEAATIELFRRSGWKIRTGDRSYFPPYEEAALELMLGSRDAALDLFDKAVDAGALDATFPKVDPLMAAMRNDPRFVAAIARIERMLAEMRQRADLSGLEDLVSPARD